MFQNRTEAGRKLGQHLRGLGIEADIVLTIPRGGLPVGRAVADALDAPLDVIVAEKIPAPGNPELAIGAVAGDGSVWRNGDLIDRLSVPEHHIESAREQEAANAREKVEMYRGGDPAPALEGKRVVLVDDGVATGATAIACLRQIDAAAAADVIFAVPVGPPDTIERLRGDGEADRVIALETPRSFGAVGRHYRSFPQVTNEEALTYLDRE